MSIGMNVRKFQNYKISLTPSFLLLEIATGMGHAIRMWSAVCSAAPHSQFGEKARLHLYMDKWNRPTPLCRRLN